MKSAEATNETDNQPTRVRWLSRTVLGIGFASLEDSLCAELVSDEQHGMGFGTLATVNGIGDLASSLIVGLLWSNYGINVAFGYSAVLFITGAIMVARLKSGQVS